MRVTIAQLQMQLACRDAALELQRKEIEHLKVLVGILKDTHPSVPLLIAIQRMADALPQVMTTVNAVVSKVR